MNPVSPPHGPEQRPHRRVVSPMEVTSLLPVLNEVHHNNSNSNSNSNNNPNGASNSREGSTQGLSIEDSFGSIVATPVGRSPKPKALNASGSNLGSTPVMTHVRASGVVSPMCPTVSPPPAPVGSLLEDAIASQIILGTPPSSHASVLPLHNSTSATTAVSTIIPAPNAKNSAHFLSGRYPAKYRRLERLGKGGCGVVWSVQRESDGAFFAAKVVYIDAMVSESKRQHALAEPTLMAMCPSAFTIRYEDKWVEPKRAVVTVMERIDGVDLCTHMREIDNRRVFHLQQVRRLARGLPELATEYSPSCATQYAVADAMDASVELTLSSHRIQQLEQKNPALRFHLTRAKESTVSESCALMMLAQILVGLYHIHTRGVIHCDVTTGNVFLCHTGLIKIGDFGLSCLAPTAVSLDSGLGNSSSEFGLFALLSSSSIASPGSPMNGTGGNQLTGLRPTSPPAEPQSVPTSTAPRLPAVLQNRPSRPTAVFLHDEAVGTPCYMAPELWCTEAKPVYTEKSDMFGVGVILFELLTGRRPFLRATTGETGAAVLSRVIPDIRAYAPDTSQEVIDLVHWLLSADPASRPTALKTLGTSLVRSALEELIRLLAEDTALPAKVQDAALAECRNVRSEILRRANSNSQADDHIAVHFGSSASRS